MINLRDLIVGYAGEEVCEFIKRNNKNSFDDSLVLYTNNVFNINKEEEFKYKSIINLERINDIKRLNKFFIAVNSKLPVGGLYIGCVETSRLRKKRILNKFPFLIAHIYYFFDFILKRVFPKFWLTKKIYFLITNGRNRVLSKAESYGRLYSSGFQFVAEKQTKEKLYFVFRKQSYPLILENPSYGPVFKMKRIGQFGNEIYCYKFRTMHPYSEFLQEYVYEKNRLAVGGKFRGDFRVNTIGKVLRKFWIDELPMIINVIKGDLKIVGVRPLSAQYLSLYDEELRVLRQKYKPGLIPPFYVDLPNTIDEIIASEKKYLYAFEKRPFMTDLRYFALAIYNIVIKRSRSK